MRFTCDECAAESDEIEICCACGCSFCPNCSGTGEEEPTCVSCEEKEEEA